MSAAAAPGVALRAFEASGVELEYMIVDRATLDVRPVADVLLAALAGRAGACEAVRGELGVSNELALHVVELKNRSPSRDLAAIRASMQALVREVDDALAPLGARLLATGMHPWMDPARETRLWPHAGAEIYRTYDRIFDCRRHGYANLQAMHVNLPFAGDEEFSRLHAAVRLVLPLVPALAAASPFVEGRFAGALDHRLRVYRSNAAAFPSIAGAIVPDTVASRDEYEAKVLAPMYREIAPADPDGVLRHAWLNSRGAIARFDRGAIEIRLADTQECPYADLAIAAAMTRLVRTLYEGRTASLAQQQAIATESLAASLTATIADAERAPLRDADYLRALGVKAPAATAGEVWGAVLDAGRDHEAWGPAWRTLQERGPLARRIVALAGAAPSRERLRDVYAALGDCLIEGRMLGAA